VLGGRSAVRYVRRTRGIRTSCVADGHLIVGLSRLPVPLVCRRIQRYRIIPLHRLCLPLLQILEWGGHDGSHPRSEDRKPTFPTLVVVLQDLNHMARIQGYYADFPYCQMGRGPSRKRYWTYVTSSGFEHCGPTRFRRLHRGLGRNDS